jgi:hypothetical protein
MRRTSRTGIPVAALTLAFFFLNPPAIIRPQVSAPPADLSVYLPKAGDVPGWAPTGEAQHYKGDDLFVYIDGGAEIYREYGFQQVLAQDYRSKSGKSVTLEIYEMTDPRAAYGIFTFKSSGKGLAVAIGQAAEFDDYYLNFWKGSFLVTTVGFDESEECRRGVVDLSKAADAKIAPAGFRPAIFDAFPAEWGPAAPRKYLRGMLGLFNIYPFFTGDVFRFEEAAAVTKDGAWVFLFRYPDEDAAGRRFPEIVEAFKRADPYKDVTLSRLGILSAKDGKDRTIAARRIGALVGVVLTEKDLSSAEKILTQIRG